MLNAVLKFVTDVTDPYLNLFRRILPPVRLGPGAIDLSPIVATFVLSSWGRSSSDLIRRLSTVAARPRARSPPRAWSWPSTR